MYMVTLVKITRDNIAHIEDRMKGFYPDNVVDSWSNTTITNFNDLFTKYKITSFDLNQNSYMGVVLDCTTEDGRHLVMKNVPNFLDRFHAEIQCLLKLPQEVRCQIFDFNPKTCMLVMEKIEPGNSAHFFDYKVEYENLFDILASNKIVITEQIIAKSFWEVVENDYQKFLEIPKIENKEDQMFAKKYYEIFQNSRSIFENETNFLLHGDVHRNNAIVGSDGIKLIDPLGFTAPFVFEFGALCAYELFDAQPKEFERIFASFCDFVKKYEDIEKFIVALNDVVIKIYIPSLFEAGDDHKKSSKLLLVLDFLSAKFKTQ